MGARDAVAGVAGVAVALGVGELGAGLAGSVPSPLDAVGQQVVALSPGGVVNWAIETLGTANRPVLTAGSVLIALLAGALLGLASRSAPGAAVVGGFVLASIAYGASLARPGAEPGPVLLVLAIALLAGLGTMYGLLSATGPLIGVGGASRPRRSAESPTDPAFGRRGFFRLSAGAGAFAVLSGTVGRHVLREASEAWGPPSLELPEPARALPAVGSGQDLSRTVEGLAPVITPNADFYRIDTAIAVPQVDPTRWSVLVHGLVERELRLTYEQLLDRELVEIDATLSCVSNEVGGDLVDNARWLGVPLPELLEEVGPLPEAGQLVGRSVDGWTGGFPLEVALDGRDALLAIGMNGDPLPARHGFPARLVVPGLYGYVSATKWLSEIELTTWEGFDGYWVPRGWDKRGPVKTSSRIDVPRRGDQVPAGEVVVAGVAWAPTRGIDRVELAVDGGEWSSAEIAPPLGESTWVQWRASVPLESGTHELVVRAVDGTGALQPEGPAPPRPNGAEGWHRVPVEVG